MCSKLPSLRPPGLNPALGQTKSTLEENISHISKPMASICTLECHIEKHITHGMVGHKKCII